MERRLDAVMIGGGGACYPAAFELARAGWKVAVVDDRGLLGGVCLYAGCVPSKAFREWALRLSDAQALGARIDPDEMWARAVEAKDRVQEQVFSQLSWLASQLSENLEFIKGWAMVQGPSSVLVKAEGGERRLEARYILLGPGSEPVVPNVPGSELAVTSDWLYSFRSSIRSLPDSVAIVGGGYIGLEAAELLSRFGVKVTLVEMMDRLLPTAPVDISRAALRLMQARGVDVRLRYRASSIERRDGHLVLRAVRDDGSAIDVEADTIIMAVGRRPRLSGYGLEALQAHGLELEGNAISVNSGMRTSLPNVYAAGDVIGKAMLYHAALKESLIAARNMVLGRDLYQMDFHQVPFVIYTYPELAYVGYTEEELKAMGVQFATIRYSMKANSYSLIKGHGDTWVKVLVEKGSRRVLGVQAYAVDAHAIVTAFMATMELGATLEDLYWMAAPHPSSMEALPESARSFYGL